MTRECRLIARIKLIKTRVCGTRECKLSRELYRICIYIYTVHMNTTLSFAIYVQLTTTVVISSTTVVSSVPVVVSPKPVVVPSKPVVVSPKPVVVPSTTLLESSRLFYKTNVTIISDMYICISLNTSIHAYPVALM